MRSTHRHPVAVDVVLSLFRRVTSHQLDASAVVGQDVGVPVLDSVDW